MVTGRDNMKTYSFEFDKRQQRDIENFMRECEIKYASNHINKETV